MTIHDYGFYRLAAVVPPCTVGDCAKNAGYIISLLQKSADLGADLAVFPALALTSASCGDLFTQRVLLRAAEEQLAFIVKQTALLPIAGVVGVPVYVDGSIYSAAAVFSRGTIYGIVPLDGRDNAAFSSYTGSTTETLFPALQNTAIPFGADMVFAFEGGQFSFTVGNQCGAALYVEPLAKSSFAGSFTEFCRHAAAQSKHGHNAYVFVNAGWGESTTDTVCAGERGIYENGELLATGSGFELSSFATADNPGFIGYTDESAITLADIDCESAAIAARTRTGYSRIPIPALPSRGVLLIRPRNPCPFIPLSIQKGGHAREVFFSQVLELQARGLAKRMHHTGCTKTVVGVSGGLDSTLALFIAVLASRMLKISNVSVTAITMPGFGTTARTKSNALRLAELLGCTVLTIPIEKALVQHFTDIDHPADLCNTVYENAQARERTQILMDKANQLGALLVGTGDLSESALGWETYNGDHMSMYNVNAGIPKTILRHCIRYAASHPAVFFPDEARYTEAEGIVRDILDTPISPELLPAQDQTIVQKTEDILGPYELHDFFLYYLLHTDFSPAKILLLAEHCFISDTKPRYTRQQIIGCMRLFYRRFFSQQFKRSCAVDGPAVGFGSFSPRTAWRMPSDMSAAVWLNELEQLSEM
ncbi:NAD(+) synthase [Treponema sp.]|uniref:NAD(+) synthase n=1 Tax=Treponema sp. TaxID=166 RepID=UPI003FA2F8A7